MSGAWRWEAIWAWPRPPPPSSSRTNGKSSSNFGVIFDQLHGKYKGILSKLLLNNTNDGDDGDDSKEHKSKSGSSSALKKRASQKKNPDWQELSKVCRVGMDGSMEVQRLVICRFRGDPSKDAGKMGRELGSQLASHMKGDGNKKWAFLLPPSPPAVDDDDTDSSSNRTTFSLLAGDFLSEMTTSLWADLYKDNRFKSSSSSSDDDASGKDKGPVSLDLIWDHPVATESSKLPTRETPAAFLAKGRRSIANGEILASGVSLAKDIVNAPHNVLNSLSLADTAQRLAAESPRLSCQILNTDDCEQLGMGSYLAVARGSETPPQFIHLIYKPPPSKRGTPV